MVETIESRHPAPFTLISKNDFDAAVAALSADIPRLSDVEVPIRMAHVAATIRDGHTVINGQTWTRYPLAIGRFPQGMYVIGTSPDQTLLAGRRIVGIGNVPIEEVRRRIEELIPQENEFTGPAREAGMMTTVEVMRGLGLTDAAGTLNLVTEVANGGTEETFIPPVPPLGALTLFPASLPRSLQRPGTNYWSEVVPDKGVLYIQYNLCQERRDLSMDSFADQVRTLLAQRQAERVVLDLRSNPGGDSSVINPLAAVLRAWEGSSDPARFKILITASTFSSAMMNALELRDTTGAEVLGETSGNNPNAFGQVAVQTLPYGGLELFYSTRRFTLTSDPSNRLSPDRTVLWAWSDFHDGIDTVAVASGL